jgi:S-DNA-T family DNA segregation ATPase FtsK/SpoIIIE
VGIVTDLDERLAARAIRSLDAEIRRRERALRDAGAVDLDDYRRARHRDGRAPLPRLVVVIDEFAALAVELPTFLSSLVGVAQRGRSLGIHLVLATQRPAGVVSDDIRANTNIRIALRLNDRHDAIDVVGSAAPAALPRSLPGRAVVRLGPEELATFQTATSSVVAGGAAGLALVGSAAAGAAVGVGDTAASELVMLARAARAAASLCEICAPSPPWLEPLPPRLTGVEPELAADVDGGGRPVGVIDDPDHQRRWPLVWRDDAGSLLVVGASGSGTTSALASVVVAAAPSSAAVYVVDARGDAGLASLGALPACAGVVGLHDGERRGRVVRCLTDELARRRSGRGCGPLLLAIDGLPSLLSALGTHDDAAERDAWVRLIAEGAAVGIRCVASADRPGALSPSVLASFAERWVLHLDDAADAATVGLQPSLVPAALPGRAVVASSGLEAQLAVFDQGSTSEASAVHAVEPIGTLATLVHPAALSVSRRVNGGCELSVGIDFLILGTASLTVPDGEHVVVLGPARSGRSTALVRIAAAWREVHPPGWVVVVAARTGGPLPAWAITQAGVVVVSTVAEVVAFLDQSVADVHGLIVVDDAERVDDHADALATLIARRDPNVLVACAARPDSLRTMYGHWTAVVRRSRLGLLLALGTDADGDLLGELLPRRTPIPARRGLAWLVDADGRRLVQVAVDQPAGSA